MVATLYTEWKWPFTVIHGHKQWYCSCVYKKIIEMFVYKWMDNTSKIFNIFIKQCLYRF